MVPNTRKVAYSASPDNDGTMFLQIVIDAGNVGGNFLAIGEPDTGNLSKSGVRFLGCLCTNDETDASLLRTAANVRNTLRALGL